MTRLAFSLGLLTLMLSSPGHGQAVPRSTGGDSRIQAIDYRPDQVVQIDGVVGYQVMVKLAPDEHVESIAIGDSGAWQATASRAGDLLFLKPLQAGVATNMTVVTDVRTYAFDLEAASGSSSGSPYIVQFLFPASNTEPNASAAPVPLPDSIVGRYRLGGDRTLRPQSISDDGVRTFIEWPPESPLPATYIQLEDGRESLANGNMRGSLFVIDSVEAQLVFRIDKRIARATRMVRR